MFFPPDTETLQLMPAIDLAAAVAGSIGGALYAVRKKFVITGVLLIAIPASLGGGILRDILLGQLPPVALTQAGFYLPAAILPALLVFFLESVIKRLERLLFLVDALSLGLFACVGAQKALAFHLNWTAALMIGTLNAVGGGILRDILGGETPDVARPGALNSAAVIIGCAFYVALIELVEVNKYIICSLAVFLIFLLRVLSVRYDWQAPAPVDLITTGQMRSVKSKVEGSLQRHQEWQQLRWKRASRRKVETSLEQRRQKSRRKPQKISFLHKDSSAEH
ncbi:trimeric intracellular cation channel family protein [Tengunoibacter tsumagoiensis]|uniref:Glycine transporter domain-containing protein n=1 Tax=Tengunoibacter tsumagoiensis TaxID=2014871 RepID=A0A401ZVN9_9CHLR|nr:TRIC cation channel family protein [Tengunoibacter tsumagoiensis]GCE10866.1 hypothetical protein KTT_07250 [Tengunoibacter tsumagoiensis]